MPDKWVINKSNFVQQMISTSRVINKDFMIEPKAMLITSGLGVLVNIVMGPPCTSMGIGGHHHHHHHHLHHDPTPQPWWWIKPWPFSWRSLLCGARSSQQSWQAQSVLIFVVVITKIFLITFIIGQSITIILMTFNFLRRKHQRLSSLYPCRRRLPPIHRCLPCCHCHLLQGDLNIFKAGLILQTELSTSSLSGAWSTRSAHSSSASWCSAQPSPSSGASIQHFPHASSPQEDHDGPAGGDTLKHWLRPCEKHLP